MSFLRLHSRFCTAKPCFFLFDVLIDEDPIFESKGANTDNMEDHKEDIATFQAITGADHETAEHVLEAHGWDLNRGVNFHMESSAAGIPEPPQNRPRSPMAPASGALPQEAHKYFLVILYAHMMQYHLNILCTVFTRAIGVFELQKIDSC